MSGFKVFTDGSILTAAEVNDYLMEQSVMRFATDAARNTGIPSGQRIDGMVTVLQSDDRIHIWNGSQWIPFAYLAEVEESRNAQILLHMDVS